MNSLQTLCICMSISLLTSSVLLAALSKPLGAFMGQLCPDGKSAGFWQRFTMVMLFLVPLLFTLCFGTPRYVAPDALDVGEMLRRAFTATSLGAFFAVIGMGLWVSSLARRAIDAPKPTRQTTPADGSVL